MDFWASLEHKIAYKFEGNAPENLLKELKACADIVDMLDAKMFSLKRGHHGICRGAQKERGRRKKNLSEPIVQRDRSGFEGEPAPAGDF